MGDGLGVAVGAGVGVAVGRGVAVGAGVGVAVGRGVAVGAGVGVAVGRGVAVGAGVGVAVGRGVAVGAGVGVAVPCAEKTKPLGACGRPPGEAVKPKETVPLAGISLFQAKADALKRDTVPLRLATPAFQIDAICGAI